MVPLGRVVNTHGVRGEVKFLPYASPCSTLQSGITVSLQGKAGEVRALFVEGVRPQPPFLLLRFQGVSALEQAQTLRESVLAIAADLLPPLAEGEFYYYQVVGVPVFTSAGECLGEISQVFFSGGHDIWVVQQGEKEYMIPVTEEIVRSIDLPGRRIVIEPLEGLLD